MGNIADYAEVPATYRSLELPTVAEVWKWNAAQRRLGRYSNSLVVCRCGCLVNLGTSAVFYCSQHEAKPMGSLGPNVERDLKGVIRD